MCRRSITPSLAAFALLALLAGCRLGPRYKTPAPPAVTAANYKESTVNFQDADGWKVASPQDAMIRGNWWEVFNEPELNDLETQLNINNQNIRVSFENYMAARAVIAEARAQYWPTVSANPAWSRSRSSGNLRNSATANTGQTSTIWSAPLEASWTPDFFGKIRNQVREAQYTAQSSAADLELEKLTEQASLAQYYFEIRGQDMLQKILNDTVAADQKALAAAQGAFDVGVGDYISVVEARSTLKSAQSSAINVGLARAQYEHAIAMLLGKVASDFTIPVKPMLYSPPANSHRSSFATCRAPTGCCRRRAHAGCGQRHHRRGIRRILSADHDFRRRWLRKLDSQTFIRLAQPLLVARTFSSRDNL